MNLCWLRFAKEKNCIMQLNRPLFWFQKIPETRKLGSRDIMGNRRSASRYQRAKKTRDSLAGLAGCSQWSRRRPRPLGYIGVSRLIFPIV